MLVSILIPVYNEERTIARIIEKVKAVELPHPLKKEIVVVNDGSKDRTAEILKDYHQDPQINIVHQGNQGKTGALLTAIKNAKGDIYLVQDADLEYDPIQYPQLLRPIVDKQAQVVYGSRFLVKVKGAAPINMWANGISNWTLNLLYGTKITDVNTCYKIFTRKAFEGITIKGSRFDLDTELTVKLLQKGLTIKEVPITYTPRSRAEGKKINWRTAVSMFWQIIKYRFTGA
jgi:glycosyltransferase involved in cell wall biosynthesis